MKRIVPFVAGAVVVALVVVGAVLFLGGSGSKTVTAYFPKAVGLYTGSSVRILGIQVGTIKEVHPEGTRVKVVMQYDDKYKVPRDAAAVVIPPSIVSDRYVQLAPAYQGGPVLGDGAVIPESRTEVPAELDQIFSNINDLDKALGPQGANKNGALSDLVKVAAKNLKGNGQQLHDTLTDVAQALGTLSDNRGDLFATIRNLQQFTTTLAQHDDGVRQINADLANVSVQLNGERQELASALKNLSVALGQVTTFVHDNKSQLTTDVKGVGDLTSTLLSEKKSLVEVLDEAPLALQNLTLAYDPATHTLRTRNKPLLQSGSPDQTVGGLVCHLLGTLGLNCPDPGMRLKPPSSPLPLGSSTPAGDTLKNILSGALR